MFSPLVLLVFPVVAFAHDVRVGYAPREHVLQPRQSSPAAASATSAAVGTTVLGPNGPSVVTSALPPPATVNFSLQSQNPTAVPLSDIVSGASSSATIPLYTVFPAGSTPTAVPGAPPIPDASLLIPSNYPTLDKVPPTDTPEVQQWITEVQNSGVTIPNISVTLAGGCPANLAAAEDQSRCWWTCGGCTRNTDITSCPTKLTWGLTYDDGPAFYTPNLLQYLDQNNLKTTFFVVGSRAISYPVTLQTEFMVGHHLAVHTWSHPPLTTLTNEQVIAELGWSKKIMKDVTGVTPNMMRPPFGDIDDRVRAISIAMGLTPVIWTRISPTATFDTGDFNIAGGATSVSEVLGNWTAIIGNSSVISTGFIVLEHDLFQQSVDVATGYILPDALAHQPSFNIAPVINCLNQPLANAYIETNNNSTNPPINVLNASSSASAGQAQSTNPSGSSSSSNDAVSMLSSIPSLLLLFAGAVAGVSAGLI